MTKIAGFLPWLAIGALCLQLHFCEAAIVVDTDAADKITPSNRSITHPQQISRLSRWNQNPTFFISLSSNTSSAASSNTPSPITSSLSRSLTYVEVLKHPTTPRSAFSPPLSPLGVSGGTHYATLLFGSPPQLQTLIIDTGSHFTAFPCKGCISCSAKGESSHYNKPFDYKVSSSHKSIGCKECELNPNSFCEGGQCIFRQSYAEGSSWEAFQIEDLVSLSPAAEGTHSFTHHPPAPPVPYVFGCQRSATGDFQSQKPDGILGLAMHKSGLVNHLVEQGSLPNKSFSLCFTKNGGYFGLGGIDTTDHKSELQYTGLIDMAQGHYQVRLVSLWLNDVLVSSDMSHFHHNLRGSAKPLKTGKIVIVDSGTTDTFLPIGVADSFKKVWREQTSGMVYKHDPIKLTVQQLQSFPTIYFVFEGGARWGIKPESFFDQDQDGDGVYRARVYLDEPGGAVLGAAAMEGKDIIFDESNGRIGWASSDCTSS